jgi:hypothetical protein
VEARAQPNAVYAPTTSRTWQGQAQRDRGGRRVRFAYQVERQLDAKIRCLPACGRLTDRVQMLRDLVVRANPPDMWFALQGL